MNSRSITHAICAVADYLERKKSANKKELRLLSHISMLREKSKSQLYSFKSVIQNEVLKSIIVNLLDHKHCQQNAKYSNESINSLHGLCPQWCEIAQFVIQMMTCYSNEIVWIRL